MGPPRFLGMLSVLGRFLGIPAVLGTLPIFGDPPRILGIPGGGPTWSLPSGGLLQTMSLYWGSAGLSSAGTVGVAAVGKIHGKVGKSTEKWGKPWEKKTAGK